MTDIRKFAEHKMDAIRLEHKAETIYHRDTMYELKQNGVDPSSNTYLYHLTMYDYHRLSLETISELMDDYIRWGKE